jgi:HSP20 family protein
MAALPVRRNSSGQNLVINPTSEFEDIYDRMGQLMNLAFGSFVPVSAGLPWVPPADLTETSDAYVVHVELPGARKDQVDVQLQDRELTIRGEIPEQSEDNGRQHRSSRRTGSFEYRTYLPGEVKADAVSAQLSDGVLTVTVPKSEAAKPRKIEITG